MRLRLLVTAVALLAVSVLAVATLVALREAGARGAPHPHVRPTPSPEGTSPAAAPSGSAPPVYLYYYLWWTPGHWQSKLGPDYPYAARPPVTPGATNSAGCNPVPRYSGSTIVDVPQVGLYNQNQAQVYLPQIEQAAAAGVTGFLASWQGTGSPTQTTDSSGYNLRLQLLVRAVDTYDAAHPQHPFRLALAMSAFGDYHRPAAEIIADLSYFYRTYRGNPAFRNSFSSRPMVMIMDSRKYPVTTVAAIWNSEGGREYLIGDETAGSWARDAPYLDATSYYWSSENPWTNSNATTDIQTLGAEVHSSGKSWFAPFIPGYDKQLVGGSCVPRDGVQTLDKVWGVNSQSHPQGWFGISWNEFEENTYFQPSLHYGSTYLRALQQLIQGQAG